MNEQMTNHTNNFGEGLFSKHGENDNVNENEDEDEDEDEDVDFNPFLKGTPSPEASSSLSSEVEAFLDGNDSSKLKKKKEKKKKKKTTLGEVTNYDVGDIEHGEEVVMQAEVCPESEEEVRRKSKKRKIDFESQSEEGNVREKDDGVSKMPEANVEDGDDEDEDAICKRTRARYSLASFTLDELETFLQETDDEDDLPRVDDEEEYRKFLAAVLHGGDGDGQLDKGNDNAEEEDEDNDADFEIELEELLDSDVDDNSRDKCGTVEYERGGRRPETRQNKRQKASAQYKKKLLEQTKRPLRPLLPILPNGPITSFPTINGKALAPATASSYPSSTVEENLMNGFTLQQIGQLHCLIHEHMQLLIQAYSLCILDPSRQHIASQLQGLICEMLRKRDEVITSRSLPYPDICFRPPFVCSSVSDELPNFYTTQCNFGPSMAPNMLMRDSENGFASNGRHDHALHEEMGSSRYASCFWMPHISGPVISILDVAPLNLVRTYVDDVYNAVRDYRQRHLDTSCDTRYEREPLFHLPCIPSVAEANSEVLRGNSPSAANNVPSTHGQQPKKTLAASIVESAKKQSIALVPRDISKLAQRFFSLFNPALFPHRPPPVAVANRVLFTDAEDELLALGIMEYNTDWKAIQQRFLPCKSTHQIFVRQKNRCSAKATENPIKAVRRMKTSPLSTKEIECIQEGLRVFKLDWTSVWKFAVPHRDPSLLPRQYRIALGTQRSYKLDAATKEKRRMYEAKRRRCKTEHLADWQQASEKEDNHVGGTVGENNSGDDCADNNVNEAYVHQAFLADWRPGASSLISSEQFSSNLREKDTPRDTLSREVSYIREQPNDYGPGTNGLNRSPYTSRHYNYLPVTPPFTHFRHYPSSTMLPNHQMSDMTLNTSKSSQIYMWPYRTCRTDGARLVKLAPELPPVNLPPSVRVISQSAFKSNQSGASVKISATGGDTSAAGKGNLSSKNSAKTKKDKSNLVADHVTNLCPEESASIHDTHAVEQRGTDSDLQMHPLLFKAPEYGRVPYYPLNYTHGSSNSFGFFSGNQPQLSLSLFHNPHQANHVIDRLTKSSKESNSASCGINFHPLLQRTDEDNSDLVMSYSNTDQIAQFQNSSGVVQIRPLVISSPFATYSKVSSLNEKANELDLEIHLSSTSVKEKSRGCRDVDANNQPMSPASTPKSGKAKGPSNSVLDVEASAVSGNDVTRCNMDDIGDQSHHEIVMEQEELSDSDEEIEEHVEFECEEMADSDGEDGSGCDYIPEVQEQESPSFAREKDAITSDDGDPQCQLRSPEHPQGNASVPQISTPPFLKLCLTSLGKDATGSSWLSLDSCAPVDSPRTMAEHEEAIAGESATSRNLTSSRPNRSCKKVTKSVKGLALQKDVADMAQQLSLGPLAVSALRRPRRRACRTNTSVGITMENSRNDQDKSS